MLDALAFLPVDRVSDGMRYLQDVVPDNLRCLAEYFDSTYVFGQYRAVFGAGGTMRFRRTAPRCSPQTWNVHEATLSNQHWTNNICESWNNGFKHLVGHSNPSLWTVIESLQKDSALVESQIYSNQQGQLAPKRVRRATIVHQNRLRTQQFLSGEKSLELFLNTIGECIRLQ